MKKRICMVVQDPMVKGGIAAVVNGYRGSKLEADYDITYVESYKDGSKFQKLLKALCGYMSFVKVLLFNKPDIVHIHSSFGPSFTRKIPFIYMASWAKIPIINHIHGSEFGELYLNACEKKQKLVKKVWGKCDKFIVLSDEWKETFSCVIAKEKMTVIENYSKVVENIQHHKCNNRVLFLGAINEMKGCYDIVDIAVNLKKKIPDVKFIIAGAGEEQQVAEKASNIGVSENIEFPGWVRDKEKDSLLKSCDLFLLPSYTEGMPMSILDAMGYGLPIVSTNVGGIPKIVKNGKNGYCCEPGDISNMSECIISMLSSKDTLESMSKRSLDIIKEKYSFEEHLKKLESLYNDML